MRFYVNDDCIGCGLCVSICPEVFALTEGDVARAQEEEVSPSMEAPATEAMDSCPTSAIEAE